MRSCASCGVKPRTRRPFQKVAGVVFTPKLFASSMSDWLLAMVSAAFRFSRIARDPILSPRQWTPDLLAFYDFPAEHWGHLRTTNPIESTLATVRLRQRRTKGRGSREASLTHAGPPSRAPLAKLERVRSDCSRPRWKGIQGWLDDSGKRRLTSAHPQRLTISPQPSALDPRGVSQRPTWFSEGT